MPVEIADDDGAKKIIAATRKNWIVECIQGSAFLDHNPNRVANADLEVIPGDRVRLTDLRDQPVYAWANPNGPGTLPAKLRVHEASFSVEFLARRNVRGSNGTLQTSTQGTVETDNYPTGAAFDFDGSAYPYTVNPSETIQELVITTAGDIDAEVTTTDGTTFTLPLAGGTGAFDKWKIDKVVFKDPNGTTARIGGGWAGE